MKELFSQIFGVPKFHLKSKPFVDRVLTFSVIDNRIWLRNFQIVEQQVDKTKKTLMLAEIGPRLVLNPIKVSLLFFYLFIFSFFLSFFLSLWELC